MSHKQSSIINNQSKWHRADRTSGAVSRPKATLRTCSADSDLRVFEEADQCTEHGLIGALLRREGLYTSHLAAWRRQRETGVLQAMALKNRGHKAGQSARFTYRALALVGTAFPEMAG